MHLGKNITNECLKSHSVMFYQVLNAVSDAVLRYMLWIGICLKFQKGDVSNLEFSEKCQFYRPDGVQTGNSAAAAGERKSCCRLVILSDLL